MIELLLLFNLSGIYFKINWNHHLVDEEYAFDVQNNVDHGFKRNPFMIMFMKNITKKSTPEYVKWILEDEIPTNPVA